MKLTNHLKALGKKYTNAEIVRMILRSLSKAWRPKVTTTQEAKDLNVLSLDAFIGSLKTHEMELNEVPEGSTRKGKSIALKSTQKNTNSSKAMKSLEELEKNEEDSFDNDDDDDEIAHLAKRISKAWIKRKKKSFGTKKDEKGKAKQMRLFASNAKSLDILDQNVLGYRKPQKRRLQRRRL